MTFKTYSDAFWGGGLNSRAGFDELVKRNKESKQMCQDLEEYLKKRSKLEADYAKSLSSLAKTFRHREEIGVLEATLNQYKAELDTMASQHNGAATFFQNQSDEVKRFKEEQNSSRKALEDSLTKAHNSKLSQLAKTISLEKTYVKKCSERDVAESTYKELNSSPMTLQKDLDKMKNKYHKAEEDAEKADSNYKSAVLVLDQCRVSWEHEMLVTCQSVQELDEKRIDFMRNELWVVVNVDSKLALDVDNSCETVRDLLEKCDIVSDIQAFIATAGTGEEHPQAFAYKHYTKIGGGGDSDSNSSGGGNDNPYNTVEDVNDNQDNTNTVTRKKALGMPVMFGWKKS